MHQNTNKSLSFSCAEFIIFALLSAISVHVPPPLPLRNRGIPLRYHGTIDLHTTSYIYSGICIHEIIAYNTNNGRSLQLVPWYKDNRPASPAARTTVTGTRVRENTFTPLLACAPGMDHF